MEESKETDIVPFNRDMRIGSMAIDHCVDQIRANIKHAWISVVEASKIRRHLANFSSKEEAESDAKGIDLLKRHRDDMVTFLIAIADAVDELDARVVAQGKLFIEHIKVHKYMKSKEYWEKLSKTNPKFFPEAMDLMKRLTKDAKKFSNATDNIRVNELPSIDKAYKAIEGYFSFVPTTVDQIRRIYAADHRFLRAMCAADLVRLNDDVYDIDYTWVDYDEIKSNLDAYERLIGAWYNISYFWHDEDCF